MHFKCAQRMLLVRRQKDYRRQILRRQRCEHVESIHARHLDVEKNNVGREFENRLNCFFSIAALADDFDIKESAQA